MDNGFGHFTAFLGFLRFTPLISALNLLEKECQPVLIGLNSVRCLVPCVNTENFHQQVLYTSWTLISASGKIIHPETSLTEKNSFRLLPSN